MSPATAGYDALVSSLRAPAPRPCESCPYRRNVPSGIWTEEEYIEERIDPATFQAITEYTSPVPLFATGAEAAAHGRKDIDLPGEDAENAMNKISRNRNSISPH